MINTLGCKTRPDFGGFQGLSVSLFIHWSTALRESYTAMALQAIIVQSQLDVLAIGIRA